jgi:hypothetical protein
MKKKALQTRMTMYEPSPMKRSRRTSECLQVRIRERMTKMVTAAWTGIQNL